MRVTIVIIIYVLFVGCSTTKQTVMRPNKLNGTWVPVKQEIGGTVLPTNAYEKQRLIISDSVYTFTAESVDKGVLKSTNDKMDIYGKEGVNAGKHFTAIYKFFGDTIGGNEQLMICYNLRGDSYPETYETKGKGNLFLSVFRKER
ncbi:MAG TPA: hypothetical protein VFP87_11090 [Chitinophagaceae bacterium]|nr:hypothetical protein [Chitinophagaceae bacterium]